MIKQIPNLFTLLNLVFSCIAITYILQNGIVIHYTPEGNQLLDIPEKIWYASLFIGLAAIVDFFDGFVARLLDASSEMGKQLDSLADVVSFGVAPAMILYQFLRLSYAKDEDGLNISVLLPAMAFILAGAAAYRLAKFNIDTKQSYGFRGVPTPAVGLLVASFPLIYWNTPSATVAGLFTNKLVLYAIITILSWLMVSNMPMLSLKFRNYSLKANIPKLILAAVVVVSVLLLGWMAVPAVFVAYIILSLIFK